MPKSAIGANKSGDILLVGALSSIIVRHCDGRYNSKPEQRRRRRTKAAFGDRERERERERAITFFQRGKNDESPNRQRKERRKEEPRKAGHNDTQTNDWDVPSCEKWRHCTK